MGAGQIFYVNVSPFFENLKASNDNFQKMGSLINLLGLNSKVFRDISKYPLEIFGL